LVSKPLLTKSALFMTGETIFRFFSVRPSAPSKLTGKEKLLLDPYELLNSNTEFYNELKENTGAKASYETLREAIRTFMASKSFVDRISALDPDMTALATWFYENRRQPARDALGSSEFNALTKAGSGGKMPAAIAAVYANLADSIVAMALSGNSEKRKSEELVLITKLLFIKYGPSLQPEDDESLGSFTSRMIVGLPDFFDELPGAPKAAAPPADNPKTDDSKEYLAALNKAHQELSFVLRYTDSVGVLSNTTQPGSVTGEEGISPSQFSELNVFAKFSSTALNEISAETKSLITTKLKLDVATANPFLLLNRITREIQTVASAISSQVNYGKLQIGGVWIDLTKFKATYDTQDSSAYTNGSVSKACSYSVGLADLLLVKQKLKGYRLGEITHVENVLRGEKRDRNHRRLNRVTDDFFTEQEREETKEHDLETTERNELQTEMSTTATRELGLDASVQVSGSFGPSVAFDSQVSSSFSSSVEESQRKATDFSKELTEKSSEKVRERKKTERRKTTVEEIEEINGHRFENTGEENIRGVYRWLDKIYDAQVFSYGQRMMFDFILPEPAAFFLYSLLETPPDELSILKPEPPKFNNAPLAPQDLKVSNYQQFIRQYNVTGAPEPPPQHITVSYSDKQEGRTTSDYARAATIQLPDYYEAFKAAVVSDHVAPANSHSVHIMIGGRFIDANIAGWLVKDFAQPRQKQLALAIHCRNVKNFSAAIDVFCELTPEGVAAWQNKVYEAIMEAYRLQLADYDEKIALASAQRSTSGKLGTDAAGNQNITRDELRKLAIMLLTNNAAPGFNSYTDAAVPEIDPGKACANGEVIRFFENAFEWNNMAYVMYPYFWGRKSRWSSAIQLAGTENEFTLFLKAGAARLQLAVRPGFEKAIVHFIQFGEIWEGNDPPLIGDKLYVPIIQEITENLSGPREDIVPYPADGKPWEISLPTSLVYLQEKVQEFEDPLEA
jgi:hypothetical protein